MRSPALSHPRTVGWFGTTAVAMGGINQSLFLLSALFIGQGTIPGQGSAAVVLLGVGLLLSWAATPGWTELVLMYPNRVGGIAATCAEAFRPYSPILANLTGVCYWWGWVPTCGLTALLASSALNQWYVPWVPVPLMASAIVLFFTLVNLRGVKWVMWLAMPIATASAVLAFLSAVVPIYSGNVDWQQAFTFHLTVPFPGWFGQVTSVMAGLYLIGFAAPAFEQAACHVGETIDPNRNVPRAIFASAGLATLYFVVLPIVWLGALGPETLGKELAVVLGPTFAPLLGGAARATAIWFMIFNMLHGTIAALAGASRTLAQLSEDGLLPEFLAQRSRTDAPWAATLLTSGMAIAFLLIGDPVWLIAAANLTYLIGIALPNVAVWLLRRDAPQMVRPFRAPRGTIVLGLLAATAWALTAVLGFQQFGLPTVIIGIAFAYSGAVLYAWRKFADRRKAGLPGIARTLHLKLTGAMLLVLVLDAVGYLIAVSHVPSNHEALVVILEDTFVVVALLTFAVGLILPGMISDAVGQVARAADRLATGTLTDFSKAMHALATGKLESAHARLDLTPIVVASRDEVGAMALSFNLMQEQVAHAAAGLDGAREGLQSMRDALRDTNHRLEERVQERTVALQAAHRAEAQLHVAHQELETRVIERTTALASANREIVTRADQQLVVVELGQRALVGDSLSALLDRAAQLIAVTLHVESTAVLELSPEGRGLRLCAGRGWPAGLVGNYVAAADSSSPAGFTISAPDPVIVEDFRTDERFAEPDHVRQENLTSALLLKIGGNGRPFGVLGAFSVQRRIFTADDVHFLEAVAIVLAAAIERKRAEEIILHSQQEAQRANLAKSEFLSRMSHELRTPLNAILGFGQLMEMEMETEALAARHGESVDHILTAGRHLLTLIDEVLDIARIESGRLDLTLEPIEIDKLLDESLALVRPLANQRGIVLVKTAAKDGGASHVLADEQRLRQVLLNLLSNAIKYNREGGRVQICCAAAPGAAGRLRIAISDTGVGIPKERMNELFSPFERLGAERTNIEGSGLGLALSRRLIEAQDGTIEVESRLGLGSTFTLTLPLAVLSGSPAALVPLGSPVDANVPATGSAVRSECHTVLYIEDNPSNLQLVRRLLEREDGIRLLVAVNGRDGLEMAGQNRPDLIFLDLHLPDLSGEEVLRHLRTGVATRDIPVVIVSADAIPAQTDALLAAGAEDYITKPLDLQRFLHILHERLPVARALIAPGR